MAKTTNLESARHVDGLFRRYFRPNFHSPPNMSDFNPVVVIAVVVFVILWIVVSVFKKPAKVKNAPFAIRAFPNFYPKASSRLPCPKIHLSAL